MNADINANTRGEKLMQACRAYYSKGQFVPLEPLKIPEGSQAIITVLDFPVDKARQVDGIDEVSHRQMEAMQRFRETIRNCDELFLEFERVKFREIEI